MQKPFLLAVVAFAGLSMPAFGAEVADLPDCMKPKTFSSVPRPVVSETLIAQGFGVSDPACTYRVAPPRQEVEIRGLW